MIIWLNGAFGAGKTTTANELTGLVPRSTLFDAEQVGLMLRHIPEFQHGDFQHHKPWRGLVVATASQVLDHLGGTLIVTQTVLVQEYWAEIRGGLEAVGIPVRHFLLHADQEALTHRIATDTKPESITARDWRRNHLSAYEAALPWLRQEAEVLDTMETRPQQVARAIVDRVGSGTSSVIR